MEYVGVLDARFYQKQMSKVDREKEKSFRDLESDCMYIAPKRRCKDFPIFDMA